MIVNKAFRIPSHTTLVKCIKTNMFGVALACLIIFFFNSLVFSVHAEPVNVIATNYQYQPWGQYQVINLSGEQYVPLKAQSTDKVAKLIIDSSDAYSLRTGESLDLGHGYNLKVKQVDINGKKVWLELDYDNQYADDQIVDTDTNYNTWTSKYDDVLGENNVRAFKVHIDHVFQGATDSLVQIDGLWLIDFANAMTVDDVNLVNGMTTNEISQSSAPQSTTQQQNVSSMSNAPQVVSQQPIAAFSGYVEHDNSFPVVVDFTDTSTGSPTSWLWDFGDGKTSDSHNVVHAYYESGEYTVKLTVKNDYGTDAISRTTVIAINPDGSVQNASSVATSSDTDIINEIQDNKVYQGAMIVTGLITVAKLAKDAGVVLRILAI